MVVWKGIYLWLQAFSVETCRNENLSKFTFNTRLLQKTYQGCGSSVACSEPDNVFGYSLAIEIRAFPQWLYSKELKFLMIELSYVTLRYWKHLWSL